MHTIAYFIAFSVVTIGMLGLTGASMATVREDFGNYGGQPTFNRGIRWQPQQPGQTTCDVSCQDYVRINELVDRIDTLLVHLIANQPQSMLTHGLASKWPACRVDRLESSTTSEAAVTLDKTSIFMCLRDKVTGRFHNIDTAMFVLIHELAHLITNELGHTNEFWKNMSFLLREAKRAGVYVDRNFSPKTPETYCGHQITGSPDMCERPGATCGL
jgi:hypothetical protein